MGKYKRQRQRRNAETLKFFNLPANLNPKKGQWTPSGLLGHLTRLRYHLSGFAIPGDLLPKGWQARQNRVLHKSHEGSVHYKPTSDRISWLFERIIEHGLLDHWLGNPPIHDHTDRRWAAIELMEDYVEWRRDDSLRAANRANWRAKLDSR